MKICSWIFLYIPNSQIWNTWNYFRFWGVKAKPSLWRETASFFMYFFDGADRLTDLPEQKYATWRGRERRGGSFEQIRWERFASRFIYRVSRIKKANLPFFTERFDLKKMGKSIWIKYFFAHASFVHVKDTFWAAEFRDLRFTGFRVLRFFSYAAPVPKKSHFPKKNANKYTTRCIFADGGKKRKSTIKIAESPYKKPPPFFGGENPFRPFF